MTPDFDTYLMDAYDRWCEDHYDTEGECESDDSEWPEADSLWPNEHGEYIL